MVKKLSLILISFMGFIQGVNAEELAPQVYSTRYSLLEFRANFIWATYFTGGVASGSAFWTPAVYFDDRWSIRLQLGASLLKDAHVASPTFFLAPELQLLTDFRVVGGLVLEAGGGLQRWITLDGTDNPIITGSIQYQFQDRILGFLDRIFISYSKVYEFSAHEQIRIGTQFRF